jgi:RNA-binding protein YlmH
VFNISRDDSLSYFKKRLVYVGGRQMENNSYVPKVADVISVRGLGRIIYDGVVGTSKKGKLCAEVRKYI